MQTAAHPERGLRAALAFVASRLRNRPDREHEMVLVPNGIPTGLGSSIFASLAAGSHPDLDSAQAAICLPFRTFEPDPAAHAVYEQLFQHFKALYFGFGGVSGPVALDHVLRDLKRIAALSSEPAPSDVAERVPI